MGKLLARIRAFGNIRSVSDILPVTMIVLTGVNRQKAYRDFDIDWDWGGNVMHSLWMCYEVLFGRRIGIRKFPLAYSDVYEVGEYRKREVYVLNKWGLLFYLEHEIIRPALKWRLKWEQVYVPQFAFAGQQQSPDIGIPYLFAIALDTTGSSEATSSTPTISSITHGGSNRLSTTNLNWGNSRTLTGAPTFGGSGYTQVSSTVDTSDGNPLIAGHRLVAPSTSSGSCTATLSGSSFHRFLLVSYTGVDQTTPTANETNNTGAVAPGSPVDYSRTSNKNGSRMWLIAKSDSGGAEVAISAGGTRRLGVGSPNINCMFDSNADVADTVSHTMTITHAGGAQRLGVVYCMLRQGSTSYTLALDQGSFTLTGQALLMHWAHRILIAQGSYTYTGFAAAIGKRTTMAIAQGSYVLTGFAVNVIRTIRMTLVQGSYTLTGQALALSRQYRLVAAYGSYALTGFAVFMRTFYTALVKHVTSFTAPSKSSTSHTGGTKHTTTYTPVDRGQA